MNAILSEQTEYCTKKLEKCIADFQSKGISPFLIIAALSDMAMRMAKTEEDGPAAALLVLSAFAIDQEKPPDREASQQPYEVINSILVK